MLGHYLLFCLGLFLTITSVIQQGELRRLDSSASPNSTAAVNLTTSEPRKQNQNETDTDLDDQEGFDAEPSTTGSTWKVAVIIIVSLLALMGIILALVFLIRRISFSSGSSSGSTNKGSTNSRHSSIDFPKSGSPSNGFPNSGSPKSGSLNNDGSPKSDSPNNGLPNSGSPKCGSPKTDSLHNSSSSSSSSDED